MLAYILNEHGRGSDDSSGKKYCRVLWTMDGFNDKARLKMSLEHYCTTCSLYFVWYGYKSDSATFIKESHAEADTLAM